MSSTSPLMAAVFSLIAGLEASTGHPIAFLDRIEDPQRFWARTAAILCQKTGDNFCDTDMRFMTSNTELTGFSQVIEYRVGNAVKRVCAILPPVDWVDPTVVGEAFGTGIPTSSQLPSSANTQAWLTLYHAAHCLDSQGNDFEEKRATAFATLGLSIISGDPAFTIGTRRSPPRLLAVISGKEAAYWAAGVGERVLLNLWKQEAVDRLRHEYGCDAISVASTSIDIERIPRDAALKKGEDCSSETPSEGGAFMGVGSTFASGTAKGVVTDANLWIWMFGNGGLGAPPKPWQPMKIFPSPSDAARYTLDVAENLARQK